MTQHETQRAGQNGDTERILEDIERDGVSILGQLLEDDALELARQAFAAEAETVAFNGGSGFFAADPYRRMVPDVLRLEQGFVAVATHPVVLEVCRRYIGPAVALTEAKGWRSNPTRRDFHGWHNDAWYRRDLPAVPRQLKLAVYLTDVDTGAFQYLRGTHDVHAPTHWSAAAAAARSADLLEVTGRAGTAFLFDSSGIHRQATPILRERDAVFLVYNDPSVPLQDEDERAYRYHPLQLNAAFLGGLDAEAMRVLGFGDRRLHRPLYRPPTPTPTLHTLVETATHAHVHAAQWATRASSLVERIGRRVGRPR